MHGEAAVHVACDEKIHTRSCEIVFTTEARLSSPPLRPQRQIIAIVGGAPKNGEEEEFEDGETAVVGGEVKECFPTPRHRRRVGRLGGGGRKEGGRGGERKDGKRKGEKGRRAGEKRARGEG